MTIEDLVYIDDTGFHFSDYQSFLTWLQDTYRTIYGADSYLEPDSQDGQRLAILAKAFYDTAAQNSSTFNSFSPVTAQGVGLSRNVKINGINRRVATNSTVDLTIVGQAGITIVNGIAQDTLGQKWDLPASVTIPGGGTITVTATAQEAGAITAEIATVTLIFTPTLGWQTVNNATAASIGAPVESDAELRIRQAQSTAIPSLTVLDGTVGAVENLDGVTNVRGYENDNSTTDANGIPGHKISLVVEGGDVTEICQAIQVHKTPGTGTYGDTSETVYDAHGMPLLIAFQRPDPVTIEITVTISADLGWTSDYEALIAAAVAEYINSVDIGNNVLFTKLFAPAYLLGTAAGETYDIATIEINKTGDPPMALNIDIDWDELPICDPDTDVTIVVT